MSTTASVTVRPRVPDDDPHIIQISNAIYTGVPPQTLERFRHRVEVESKDERDHVERYVADRDGEVVGYLVVEKQWWTARPGGIWSSIRVRRDLWGQGIGRRLYEYLLERAHALEGNRIYTEVREDIPEANAFAERRGFTRTGHGDRESRLDVRTANLNGFEGVEEQLQHAGIRITSLHEMGIDNEELLQALYAMEQQTIRDIPSSEEVTESWQYHLWREEMLHGPGRSAENWFVALDGDIPAGVARLTVVPPNNAYNGYTGVARQYRGKGVARALKLRTIKWAQAHDIDFIYTGNDFENQRMLSINDSLGYVKVPSQLEFVKEL